MAEENYTLIQGYEWNVPADQKHWRRLKNSLQSLKDVGVDNILIPPACKGAEGPNANGYDIYDLWDLGEFDQKGGKPTKFGTKEDLVDLCNEADKMGMGIYFDAVLNHKAGADEKELCKVQEVDLENRTQDVGQPREMEAWVNFTYPGRDNKYSSMKWHQEHFSGTDYDAGTGKIGIWRFLGDGKYWSASVGEEHGNNDFLMFADVDYSHPEVENDTLAWAVWVIKELKLKGFRLDACQHFSQRFTNELIDIIEKEFGKKKVFLVGEYCTGQLSKLLNYLSKMDHKFALYDVPLINNFNRISTHEKSDLRTVFDDTLVSARPANAVVAVMNHDTQPGQTVETKVEGFFKPLAYSLILLRDQGYPCVFYGDIYGTKGKHAEPPACNGQVTDIILARKLYAYGDQEDYWDNANWIGFVRRGTATHPDGLACVMSNTEDSEIRMSVGGLHKGEIWTDVLGWHDREVKIEDDGYAVFPCKGVSVSIWVNKDAAGRDRFGKFDSDIYSKA